MVTKSKLVVLIVWSLSCVDSLRPHGLEPTRLLCPRDFPGKNTGGPTQLKGQEQAEDFPGHIQDTESSVT